ncbi:unnamed protein product [Camellia sinensis]
MMYGQNAILVNEFLGHSWRQETFEKPQAVIREESQNNADDDQSGESVQFDGRTVSEERGDQIRRRNISSGSSSVRTTTIIGANQNRKKGMILPFEQHFITFDEIKYSVDIPQEMKEQGAVEDRLMLLKGISGAFRSGVLTAVMGLSGYVEGKITISGYPKKQETFARISGYCEQNDIHSPHVTIYESLLYSAWLRFSPEVTYETRKMFIEEVMELVELTPLREAIVGLPGVNGLAIEQRKRLTIAVDLVANPSIIFMDEPTSGLDARAAAIVMRTVRNTIDTGRTVVCTIHVIFDGIKEVARELVLGIDFSEVYKSSELYSVTIELPYVFAQAAVYGVILSWTFYGLVASQFGDIKDKLDDINEMVEDFLKNYFGFRHDFVGVAAAVVVGFTIIFTFTFAFSIKAFNFQRR